jgi:signal transduction histidine kinase
MVIYAMIGCRSTTSYSFCYCRVIFAIILSLAFVIPAFTPAVCPANDRIIVVGGNRDYPPYEFLDDEGNAAGYNVDLTKAIANVMGLNVRFRLGAWVDVRKSLDTGSVDVMQGMSYSEGRATVVDFSIPHTVVNHSVFARKGSPVIMDLEDLQGKEVAFHNRGFFHDFIIEKGLKVKPVLTDTQADALRLIASGKHDYAVVASLPAAYLIKKYQLTNLVPVARSIASVKYCYAVKKGNTELLAKFNEGLAILKQTGQYQAIYDKWLGVLEPQGVPWRQIIRYGSLVVTLFVLALAGSLLWSRTLKKQVALRTAALEQEVHERQRAVEELRLRQQQLVQADKMASLGTLVSGVAHEINNPNGLILMNTPLIMDYLKDIEPILEAHYKEHGDFMVAGLEYSRLHTRLSLKLNEIQDGARKIKRIVDDLKDFARRDESAHFSIVDLNEIAQAAVRLVENTIRKSTDSFVRNYASDIPKIRGNAQRIEQVIVNLILNACQALRSSNESITISTEFNERSNVVLLTVSDEGKGISSENLPYLTDPFFTTKREYGGTGLGLYVSAGIIKEHQGTIEFSSVCGRGTKVTITLPAEYNDEMKG